MRTISVLVIVLCLFIASTATEAAEIFLMLSFRDFGKVFRVKTDCESLKPIGLFFDCDQADGFYIDNLKDFRMLTFNSPQKFTPIKTTLLRQVFDGQISLADSGGKTSLHQDQRNKLIKDSTGKPVYRTIGAPFSCGPGRKISGSFTPENFAKGELEIFPEKNWYQIANSSWYQTWHKTADDSYKIFFDEWQEGQAEVIETLWRGQTPAYAASRPVHSYTQRRLLRAITDGTLEIIKGYEQSFVVTTVHSKICWAFDPGFKLNKGSLVIYSWSDNNPGSYSFISNQQRRPKLLLESREADNRHIGFTNYGIIVVGTDIIQKWLKEIGNEKEALKATCDLAAFYNAYSENTLKVAIFSKTDNCLYIFSIDQENFKIKTSIRKQLSLNPDALAFDNDGNVLLTAMREAESQFFPEIEPGFELETMQFDNIDNLGEFDEEKGLYVKVKIPKKIIGKIIFSKEYLQQLFVFESDLDKLTHINDVNLGKEYFYREFILNHPPEDLLNFNYQQLIDLAKKPENVLSELKSDVPDFPDQFKKPQKVFIGVYQEY